MSSFNLHSSPRSSTTQSSSDNGSRNIIGIVDDISVVPNSQETSHSNNTSKEKHVLHPTLSTLTSLSPSEYLSNQVDVPLWHCVCATQPCQCHPHGSGSEDYTLTTNVIQGNTFTVDARYDFHDSKTLGRGTFTVLCNVYDRLLGKHMALKRYRPYAEDDWDARALLREIRIMRLCGEHESVSLPPFPLLLVSL